MNEQSTASQSTCHRSVRRARETRVRVEGRPEGRQVMLRAARSGGGHAKQALIDVVSASCASS
jgi:hypothetical protein